MILASPGWALKLRYEANDSRCNVVLRPIAGRNKVHLKLQDQPKPLERIADNLGILE
jgi:hypothetical protein